MSGFSPDWLRLRAPLDAAARSKPLLQRFARSLPRPARLIDLGAGTGATLRAVAPAIGGEQTWTLIDNDPALLGAVEREMSSCGWGALRTSDGMEFSSTQCHVQAKLYEANLARSIEDLTLTQADAIVASALLDLVSEAWSWRLAQHCAAFRRPLYLALSFDGRLSWTPDDPRDDLVRCALLEHQRRDKGFGSALGPDAARVTGEHLDRLGFDVAGAESDWHIRPQDGEMQHAFLAGIHAAACEQAPQFVDDIEAWAALRRRQIEKGVLNVTVGHQDLLAYPPPFSRA